MNIENYKYSIKQLLSERGDRKEVERQIINETGISDSHWRKIKNLRVDSPREMRASDLLTVAKILGVSVEELINPTVFS